MKILLDTCVWGKAKKLLEESGHDTVWAGDWRQDPGDEEILKRAFSEGRVLVTLDKDFGELAVVYGVRHCGIVRLVNLSAMQQSKILIQVLTAFGDELLKGAIVTAEAGRFRIRAAEQG